jgi:hypothetical protein
MRFVSRHIVLAGNGVADIGWNSLKWADQHIHHLDEHDPTWYFGSDMAIFHVQPNSAFATAWCVMVDLDAMTADVMYLIIADSSVEDAIERALRGKAAFRSGPAGTTFLDAFTKSIDPKHFTAHPALMQTLTTWLTTPHPQSSPPAKVESAAAATVEPLPPVSTATATASPLPSPTQNVAPSVDDELAAALAASSAAMPPPPK